MRFTKRDFIYCLVTGLTAGTLGWWILLFSGFPEFAGFPAVLAVLIIPIIWLAGVKIGYFLGRWANFFNQFGKFAVVGFTNFAVDTGMLDYLIFLTDANRGLKFSIFKLASFSLAVSHSYFWNRYWVFGSTSHDHVQEFSKFVVVAIASAIVNVTSASIVVNFISPQLGLTANAWANVGSAVGAALALMFSFVGFKLGVFKK